MGYNSKKTLLEKILEYDIIVVEGYDGVGKTTFIRGLLPQINGIMYRPDYYYWESLNFPKKYRSFIGASILDFLSSVPKNPGDPPIIFDRGVLSGMVYTNPIVGKNYQYLISKSGRKVLHLIISTDEESYHKYAEMRGSDTELAPFSEVEKKTLDYITYAELLGLDYEVVSNLYNQDYADKSVDKCGSCGHYCADGYCSLLHKYVEFSTPRCSRSSTKEVQDSNVD